MSKIKDLKLERFKDYVVKHEKNRIKEGLSSTEITMKNIEVFRLIDLCDLNGAMDAFKEQLMMEAEADGNQSNKVVASVAGIKINCEVDLLKKINNFRKKVVEHIEIRAEKNPYEMFVEWYLDTREKPMRIKSKWATPDDGTYASRYAEINNEVLYALNKAQSLGDKSYLDYAKQMFKKQKRMEKEQDKKLSKMAEMVRVG